MLYPEFVTIHSHGPNSVYVKWRGVSTGLFEETLRGYKVTVFRKRQEATLIEKSVKLSNELCVDYIKISYILLFLHVLPEKKTHKRKVNSCFDSSEITANEGGVVNEF